MRDKFDDYLDATMIQLALYFIVLSVYHFINRIGG